MATAKVSTREIIKINLNVSLTRTNLAKLNLCKNYITYRIIATKHYVSGMGRDIRYYESIITNRFLRSVA